MVSKLVDPEKHLDALNRLYFLLESIEVFAETTILEWVCIDLHVIMQRERYTNMAPVITCDVTWNRSVNPKST